MATIAYLRVSTDDQDLGLDAQDLAIRAKYEPAAVFIDDGLSGGKADRPGLLEALSTLKKGDELVVAKRDRLSRGNSYLTAWIEKEVAKAGARIVSVAGEGTESDEPQDILMRRIIDAFAEFERLQIGARTKAALAVKKSKGERIGDVPFGFDAEPDLPVPIRLAPFDPLRQLFGLVYGRRQHDELDTSWEHHHRLFYGTPSIRVIQVMNFIEDYLREVILNVHFEMKIDLFFLQRAFPDHLALEERISEDLGRHDKDFCLRVKADISCDDADGLLGEFLLELVELLVAEGLDRAEVDHSFMMPATMSNSSICHKGLARASWCRNQYMMPQM